MHEQWGDDRRRSQLEPFVEALVDESIVPTIDDRLRGPDETAHELRLLGRACASAVVLAVGTFAELTPVEIAVAVCRREGFDERRAAFAEDCFVTLAKGPDIDPSRLIRADDHQVMAGFVYVTAAVARLCAERLPFSPLEIVRVCFRSADGSLDAEG